MTTSASASIRNQSLTNENAYEEVQKLQEVEVVECEGVVVYSGGHPEHGNIHIIIPLAGAALMLLPFVLHAF